jgi:RNA-directed DNA polymerase
MARHGGQTPGPVPDTASLPGETRPQQRGTVEPLIWTERMLAALHAGVKGGRWYTLIDKLHPEPVLRAAFAQVRANRGAAGVDHVTVAMFEAHLDENLRRLSEALRSGSYRPQPIRRCLIPKPGSREMRPLGIPTVRDRVVQTALRMVLEPIFECAFAPASHGFRPGRGCKTALRRVDSLLGSGHTHVVEVDLRRYFDTIPHRDLMALIGRKVADGRLLALVESFLSQGVLEGLAAWTPEEGCPQGAVISPLLSNIYLDPLDHMMAARGFEMVRYADDLVVLCRSAQEAAEALAAVEHWTAQAGLALHPDKTRVVDAYRDGFEFLGYRFVAGRRWPRARSLAKLKDAVRVRTRRTSGQSLPVIIADLNRVLRGWFEYFKHSDRTTFPSLDGFIRRRLRSLLRKRQGRKGNGYGADHQRWPNAFFAGQGLYCLQAAHARVCQSSRR